MQKTTHQITHHYQLTNNACGYAALATLLSHYGKKFEPEDLVGKVPQPKAADGTVHGSVTAQLAEWCQTEGFSVHMYVADMYILDLSWKDKNSAQIKERLEQVKSKRNIAIMDSHWVGVYEDAYLSLLKAGAELTVLQFITTRLLNTLLDNGPIFANVCSTAHSGLGRTFSPKLREDIVDDIKGRISTHSVIIYGSDENGDYLVSDPWDGLTTIEPEHMVLAIEAAQIECDNQIFIISHK